MKVKLVAPNGIILDNGCGQGSFAEKHLEGKKVVAIDLSTGMLKRAQKRLPEPIRADAQQLPFAENSFDTVIARGLLHHLPDPDRGAEEVARVLKGGGKAVFVDPLSSALSCLRDRFSRKSDHFSDQHRDFRKKELSSLLSKHFELEALRPFGYIAYPLLGFPDLLSAYKHFPFKRFFTPALIKLDELISKIPILKYQAFGIMALVKKLG